MEFILDNLEFIVVIGVFYWFYMQNQKKNAELAALKKETEASLEEGEVKAQEIKEEMISEAVKAKVEKIEIIKNAIAIKEAEIAQEMEELKSEGIEEAIAIVEEILDEDVEETIPDTRETLIINSHEELINNLETINLLKNTFGPFKVNLTYPISATTGFGPLNRRNKNRKCDCHGGLLYSNCHFPDKVD